MNLTAEQLQDIITTAMEKGTNPNSNEGSLKKKASLTLTERDQLVQTMLNDPSGRGLRRIAYAMTEPLRKKLDYVGIGRKFLMTDLIPQGAAPYYDGDFDEVLGTKLGARGNPPTIESWSTRTEIPTFEIATVRSIKYAEINIRRFDVLNRAKDRAAMELKLAEDTEIFSVLDTAATASGNDTAISGDITRSALAESFSDIENNRLLVGNILMNPTSFKGIRKFNRDDLDQVNFQSLLETGLLGSIFGTPIYVSTLVSATKIYIMTRKEQFGRIPIRYDVEIKPFDFPPERAIFFSIYENLGVAVYNNDGIATITRSQ